MRSPDELARDFYILATGCQYVPLRYAGEDASGHLHVGAGVPEGGQFTGNPEHGQSPDDMAASFQGEESDDPQRELRIATSKENAIKDILSHQADYGEEDPEMPANLMNEILGNAEVDPADRQQVLDQLYDQGFLTGDAEVYSPGPVLKALGSLKEFAADNPDDMLDEQMIANLTGTSIDDANEIIYTLFDDGYLEGEPGAIKIAKNRFEKIGRKWCYADAAGHEHLPGGTPEGGQFTGGAGQSPDEMAAKMTSEPQAADSGKAAVASVQNYIDNITKGGASAAKIEEALAPLAKVPTDQLAAVAAQLKIAGRVKSRKALMDQVRQVMTNLSTNWIKYGPQSGA